MQFTTRRPSGKASYPIVLLAGVQGGGKSWAAAESTGLPYFKRSFWIELGEQMADEYGDVPGADYEIIDHDGSYRQILGACRWAAAESKKSGPGVLVFDSMTELWNMLSDEQQIAANDRMDRKASNGKGPRRGQDQEADITVDLWNKAKDRSNDVMDALREFNGLVIVTARLDDQAVIGAGGHPTGARVWKMRTHKDVPFYAQVIMQAREPRKWTMTKVASTKLTMPDKGYMDWPDFTIEELLIRMELDGDRDTVERRFVRADPGAAASEEQPQRRDRSAERTGPAAEEPRGDLEPLPANAELRVIVAELEERLDKPELLRLYQLAKAHGNRIATALTESAGKRVARRLEAGEQPPAPVDQATPATSAPEETEEERIERELAALDAARDAELADLKAKLSGKEAELGMTAEEKVTEREDREAAVRATEERVAAARQSDAEQPEQPDAPEGSPEVGEAQTDAHGNVLPPADPESSRQDTPRRRGVINAILEHFNGSPDDMSDRVFGEFGLDVENIATRRLGDYLKQLNG